MARTAQLVTTSPTLTAMVDGATYYPDFGIGHWRITQIGTENSVRKKIRVGATVEKALIRINSNAVSSTSTYVSRKNGANGNITISITSDASGDFSDDVNSDALVSTDLYCFSMTLQAEAGTNNMFMTRQQQHYRGTGMPSVLYSSYEDNLGSNVTQFGGLAGDTASQATELTDQVTKNAGTFSFMWDYAYTNTCTQATTVRLRKNMAGDGNSTVSITALTTGIFEDTVNTDSAVTDDGWGIKKSVPVKSGNCQESHWGIWFTSTDGHSISIGSATKAGFTVSDTTARYYPYAGAMGGGTDASQIRITNKTTLKFSKMNVRVSANSVATASWRSRINDIDGNMTISITGSGTGEFNDDVNSDSLTGTDTGNMAWTNPGSGSITFVNDGVLSLVGPAGTGRGYAHVV